MIMQKEKLKGYESPTTELIVLQIENGILVVSGGFEEGDIINDLWD